MAKVTREDIKHDLEGDVVMDSLRSLITFVVRNQNFLLITLILAAVVYMGMTLYQRNQNAAIARDNLALARAEVNFNNAATPGLSDTERDRYLAEGDASIAEVLGRRPKSPMARRALLLSGKALSEHLDFESARQRYEEYAELVQDDVARARAHRAIGFTYENEAFVSGAPELLEKAEAAYRDAIDLNSEGYIGCLARIDLARLLGADADGRDEAIKILREAIEIRRGVLDGVPSIIDLSDEAETASEVEEEENPLQYLTIVSLAEQQIDRLEALADTATP